MTLEELFGLNRLKHADPDVLEAIEDLDHFTEVLRQILSPNDYPDYITITASCAESIMDSIAIITDALEVELLLPLTDEELNTSHSLAEETEHWQSSETPSTSTPSKKLSTTSDPPSSPPSESA